MRGHYREAREVFIAAVAMDSAEERARHVDEACGGDAALRAEVERLLAAHAQAGEFLECPVGEEVPVVPHGEHPGDVIGRYKLLGEIGEGAFGRVFMAEQVEPVRRKVALKVVKPGMDSREVVARFEAERQALALMDHPNIAHVLDAGATVTGRPYFVMELVRGQPITQYCDEHELPLGERLRLFTAVCHAVQHAHQKGVIHRDLKPSNILVTEVDGNAVPKVIDFGVAKALGQQLTERTLFTAFQQLVGTPAYMSPEQTALSGSDVDTRSDVYSLGVLLYELLTGMTPLDTANLHQAGLEEIRRMIRETEPLKPSTRLRSLGVQLTVVARHRRSEPSTLTRFVTGDLDWIVMKALEKDRARRYQTISALAEDIGRHLGKEPVSAGPPGIAYRARKFVRRHRSAFVMVALIATVLVAASIVSILFALDSRNAEKRSSQHLVELGSAYRELEAANRSTLEARDKSRHLLVETLIEKGAAQFNAGDVTGLVSFQKAVAAAEDDEQLRRQALEFWSVAGAWLPGEVREMVDRPFAVGISPDGSLLAWCTVDALHTLRTDTGEAESHPLEAPLALRRIEGGFSIHALDLVFSPDGTLVAINNPDAGAARVWRAKPLQPATPLLSHPAHPRGLPHCEPIFHTLTMACFDPSGERLVTLAANGTACLWDLQKGELAAPALSFDAWPAAAGFSPSGNLLVIGTGEWAKGLPECSPGIHVFDAGLAGLPKLGFVEAGAVGGLRFIDEHRLVVRGAEGAEGVTLWDLQSGEPRGERDERWCEGIALSPDRMLVAIGARDGRAGLRECEGFSLVGEPLEHGGGARCVDFNRDGSVLVTGGLDGTVQAWHVGKPTRRIGIWPQPAMIDRLAVARASAGLFVTKSHARDGSQPFCAVLRRLPQRPDRPIGRLPADGTLMDVSVDGRRMLVRSAERMQLLVCDPEARELAAGPVMDLAPEGITAARFQPGRDQVVFSASKGTEQIYCRWDVGEAGGAEVVSSIDHSGDTFPSAPNRLAGVIPGDPARIIIQHTKWVGDIVDLVTGETLKSIQLGNRPWCATVAPAQGWIGIGEMSGSLRRFRCDDYQELLPPLEFCRSLPSAACSGDGEWLVLLDEYREGLRAIRAVYVGAGPPFSCLRMPLDTPARALFPVEERGFVFQEGGTLRRFDLPEVPLRIKSVVSATSALLGVREGPDGGLRLLNNEEFHRARAAAGE